MDFSRALLELKAGLEVRRREWFGRQYVALTVSDRLTVHGSTGIPTLDWTPTLDDLLAEDWEVIED